MADPNELRYLSAADVVAALPPVDERLALAERTMRALVSDAELPPKIGVHPREAGSFGHAMPALLRGAAADGSDDRMGMKWVVGFPSNRAAGLPAIHGTVLLSDARTGVPRGIIDAGPLTAHRTAAVSGVAIARWAPRVTGRPVRIGMIGAGAQGHSHLPVLAHLLPGAVLAIHDAIDDAAAGLAAAAEATDAFTAVATTEDAETAIAGADLVLTLIAFGPERQRIRPEAFAAGATVIAVDYDMCVPAAIARDAAAFLVDDRGQFLATRSATVFRDYPDPGAMLGEALATDAPRPDGLVLVTHLGVGLADVIVGDALLRTAAERGIGVVLPR
jgi:hypothetical protein